MPAPRRLLIVDAGPDALDAVVADIAAVLARAGCPVRRIDADGARPPGEPAPPPGTTALRAGDLDVLPDARTARRRGAELALTRIEFDLLVELIRHANRVLTKDALLASVWRHEPVTANAIEARVSRLRAKLEQHGPRLIHTVRGVGYVLHALPEPARQEPGSRVVIELVAGGSAGAAAPA